MPFWATSKFSIFPTLHLRITRRFARPLKDSWHDDGRERRVHCGPCPQSWRDAGYKEHARVRTGPRIEHRKLDTQSLSLSGSWFATVPLENLGRSERERTILFAEFSLFDAHFPARTS